MQLDPIKPTLNAPGAKRLKLDYDEPLSNFAFKINLRRYIQGFSVTIPHKEAGNLASCGALAYTTFQTLVYQDSAFFMSVPEAHRPF